MSSTTKRQEYTYNYRSASLGSVEFDVAAATFINRARLRLEPPDDLLHWSRVWSHLILRFNTNVKPEGQVLTHFGLANEFLTVINSDQPKGLPAEKINRENDNFYVYDIGKQADGDRFVEYQMDLTQALDREKRNFAEVIFMTDSEFVDPNGNPFSGIIHWKIDALYTTKEIR